MNYCYRNFLTIQLIQIGSIASILFAFEGTENRFYQLGEDRIEDWIIVTRISSLFCSFEIIFWIHLVTYYIALGFKEPIFDWESHIIIIFFHILTYFLTNAANKTATSGSWAMGFRPWCGWYIYFNRLSLIYFRKNIFLLIVVICITFSTLFFHSLDWSGTLWNAFILFFVIVTCCLPMD